MTRDKVKTCSINYSRVLTKEKHSVDNESQYVVVQGNVNQFVLQYYSCIRYRQTYGRC